mmetsp:Transcript_5287/g.12585  ORF Transcript_5287/g.12585 Transcript_5287/m.12585 type:complete len:689 (+) Transcript_5287:222-2288(+)|eukprot:CAMPEP_0116102602 /NCGR_PEP_ID=MMETSP0327-20121206/13437_1 /TAXON_ID=44447 /ORGANISM="Pseudo-nitzschia delicatissima, Strain B596" /LENGTH=688 /DNA_ID=CAMNT_0003594653 /DNA_START=123 /DNA_END=2189 /DNA_ORIENTATION=+
MSRRRGEFEHRTSIFEGAFRAWSHLGGLEPEELENKPSADLDPLSNPIENDLRLQSKKDKGGSGVTPDGGKRRLFPYEPLPRSGLAHPYVQAILSPWLGPDADNDAIQLGLTTLRTWWQHRRKGESGSAIAALGTEKMKGVVEGYTRHFFTLAHCLVINDKEQPPRTLHSKMKELEKVRGKRKKKRSREGDQADKMNSMSMNSMGGGGMDVAAGILNNQNLSPLERLHIAQQNQLNGVGGIKSNDMMNNAEPLPIINIKNKCVPGMPDLPGIVDKVSRAATQLAHSGAGRSLAHPSAVTSSNSGGISSDTGENSDIVPIVYVTENRDIMIAMKVNGITCAHCVKIVETVLKGCNGNKSPIDGLVDAAADRSMSGVLIRIDRSMNAKRISLEAMRNLTMVGYTAHAMTMSSTVSKNGIPTKVSQDEVMRAFEAVGALDPKDLFDWSAPCTCPDNGVARDDCLRHGQINNSLLDAFDARGLTVRRYLAGEMPQPKNQPNQQMMMMNNQFQQRGQQGGMMNDIQPLNDTGGMGMDMFGGSGGMNNLVSSMNGPNGGMDMRGSGGNNMRNPPVISFGNHRMSLMGQMSQNPNHRMSLMGRMSEVSYGRAMSGLSALSIDWENLEDFDVNVDHSEHINNNLGASAVAAAANAMGRGNRGTRVASNSNMRNQNFNNNNVGHNLMDNDAHVQFKI